MALRTAVPFSLLRSLEALFFQTTSGRSLVRSDKGGLVVFAVIAPAETASSPPDTVFVDIGLFARCADWVWLDLLAVCNIRLKDYGENAERTALHDRFW
jgi:hypothetical protein